MQYTIPESNFEKLAEGIAKLNKRAAKLGCAAITLEVVGRETRYEATQPKASVFLDGEEGLTNRVWLTAAAVEANQASKLPATLTGAMADWLVVEVVGEAPSFDGWSFVASLEAVEVEGGKWINLIQCIPGLECPAEYRDIIGRCDHCGHKRYRRQTFVVRHEDGSTKCVGRQCLKDFLAGHKSPEALAAAAELLFELGSLCSEASEDFGWGGGGLKAWPLDVVLSWTASVINAQGWASRTVAREWGKDATADVVWYVLNPPMSGMGVSAWKERRAGLEGGVEAAKAEAEAAITWAKGLTEEQCEKSNYLANVNTVARMGRVDWRTVGIGASILPAFRREQQREVELQKFAKRPPSVHVGVVGKRQVFTVTVDGILQSEGMHGVTGIHKMHDEVGNDLVWFASGSTAWLEVGHTYKVKATTKSHGDYKGRPQTVVSRVAVVEEVVEVAAG